MATITSSVLTKSDFHAAIHQDIGSPNKKYIKIGHGKSARRQAVSGEHRCQWAGSSVNITSKTINVTVYLDFQGGSLDAKIFSRLKQLASVGIGDYWSRKVVVSGVRFNVFVTAVHRKHGSIGADLKLHKGSNYARSHNSGFIDATFIYNQGFYLGQASLADAAFKKTSAHEFGHSVLDYFGGLVLSWGHKGSTHVVPQNVKAATPGYPMTGEIDLMKYYDSTKNIVAPINVNLRTIASEVDVKRLIWMSDVEFLG